MRRANNNNDDNNDNNDNNDSNDNSNDSSNNSSSSRSSTYHRLLIPVPQRSELIRPPWLVWFLKESIEETYLIRPPRVDIPRLVDAHGVRVAAGHLLDPVS